VGIVMNTGDFGVSGAFTIASPVGVGDGKVAFALKGATSNPTNGPLGVSFSLPDGKKATLSLYDITGRRVASHEVGTMGAGRHTVTFASRLPAGMYMIRLDREGARLTARAAVIQ
jgi:Secretion system C-terminal sorting domain